MVRKIINQIAISKVYKEGGSGKKTGCCNRSKNFSGYGREEGREGKITATNLFSTRKKTKRLATNSVQYSQNTNIQINNSPTNP